MGSRRKHQAPVTDFSEADEAYSASTFGGITSYMRNKRVKLQNQDSVLRSLHPNAPQIFRGYTITSLGYLDLDTNLLRKIVVQHGGVWREFKEGGATIIIARDLPPKKKEELKGRKVVMPEWVMESVKKGQVVSWTRFRVGGEGEGQARLGFGEGGLKVVSGERSGAGTPYKSYARHEELLQHALETVKLPLNAGWEIPASDDEGELEEEEEEEIVEVPKGQPPEPMPGEEDEAPPCGQPPSTEEYIEEHHDNMWLEDPTNYLRPSHQPERNHESFEEDEDDTVRLVELPETSITVSFASDTYEASARGELESATGAQSSQAPPPTAIIEGEPAYEVEAVIGERKHPAGKKPKNKRGKIQLLVKWKGYEENEATWQFEDTLREDLGDQALDEMWGDYKASKASKSTATPKSSQKPRRRKSSQQVKGGSQQQKVVFSQVTKPSSQSSNKDSRKTSVATEQIGFRSSQDPAAENVLPTGFSFLPESFSTVILTPEDKAAEADVEPPAHQPERPKSPDYLPPSSQLSKSENSDDLPRPHQLHVLKEAPNFQIEILAKLVGVESGHEDILLLHPPELKEDQETKCILPQLLPDKTLENGVSKFLEIPNSISSIHLTSDIIQPNTTTIPPSSPPSAKSISRKRSAPTESSIYTPKKLKYTNLDTEGQKTAVSSKALDSPNAVKNPKINKASAQTPEEFNEAFLAVPKIRDASVLNPDFLPTFFKESRLHYLSTWKSDLRARLQKLAEKSSQPTPPAWRSVRYVMHVDFDCFFAAVSTRDRPDLKDKPVAICHGRTENSTTSEIASCNYAARKFGVKNGMWMASAKKLCPDIITLGYDFDKYEEASEAFYDVLVSIDGERLQAVSVDEVLVDISNLVCNDNFPSAADEEEAAQRLARKVRDECQRRTGCEVSVGIGTSVLTARLALRKAKPAGQYIIPRSEVQSFLDGLEIRAFPGIGKHTANKIVEKFGSDAVSEIRKIPQDRLKQVLGAKTGVKVYELCRGVDETLVGAVETPRESISISVNWGVRFYLKDQAEEFLHRLAHAVEERMKSEGVKGRTLNFQVAKRSPDAPFETEKFLGCGRVDVTNRTSAFGVATCDAKLIARKCVELLRRENISPGDIRGFGIGMKGLEDEENDNGQQLLKFRPAMKEKKEERLPNEQAVKVRPKSAPVKPELKPAAPIRVTAYVKPKPVTLLDAFAKKTEKKKPEVPVLTAPLVKGILVQQKEDTPETPQPARIKPAYATPPLDQKPSRSQSLPQKEKVTAGLSAPYAPPKVTTLLDKFSRTRQSEGSPVIKQPPSVRKPKDPTPPKAMGGIHSSVQKNTSVPTTPLPASTELYIPSESQIDISCLSSLTPDIQELVLQQHPHLREVLQQQQSREATPEPEQELEKPPDSQWDVGDWNSFPKEVRDEIRTEHEADKAAKLARENALSPQKPKQDITTPSIFNRNLSNTKSPIKRGDAGNPTVGAAAGPPFPFVFGKNHNRKPPQPNRKPLVKAVYDRHGVDVSSWLFSPTEAGGGIDPEIFFIYDNHERAQIVSARSKERNAILEKEAEKKAAEAREKEMLQNAIKIKSTRRHAVLCLSVGGEVGSADVGAVRKMIRSWVKEVDEVEDGDMEMLRGFLRAIVIDEGRLDKAAGLVRYFLGLCGDREGWTWVCDGVVGAVQEAARQKGLRGRLEF
ncbi:hypothetical protein BDD12DRAFT_819082 [Trichophaea hybrida]|nr:hypothetical protein BDD12DRAFT_819082 [Trichophaea hybrida]